MRPGDPGSIVVAEGVDTQVCPLKRFPGPFKYSACFQHDRAGFIHAGGHNSIAVIPDASLLRSTPTLQ